jgi:serine/threonine protein kinase
MMELHRPTTEASAATATAATAADDDMPRPGDVLGKYQLLDVLGQGGSCRVYRGKHTRLPIQVAVKVLNSELASDQTLLAQLRDEAALLAGLNHPNIVRLWDFDDEGKHPYIVTELVDGRTLAELIEQSGPLMPDWAVYIMAQVVEGLAAAHQLGIVHRDIKPGNILLTKDGKAKLVDLGLALVQRAKAGPARPELTPTRSHIMGTAAYIAPEQARNPDLCDHRADMYSLGATFYHALTGRMPFEGRSRMDVIIKHLQEPLVPPRRHNPSIPAVLSGLIERLMAKNPAERFATYDELAHVLRLLAECND